MNRLIQYFTSNEKVEEEYQQYALQFESPVPEELSGVLFRNGNGRFVHHGVRYDHLFDGDGMITSFAFQNGEVRYSNRYVQTKEFIAENEAGKMLYRSFGTNLPGGLAKNAFKTSFKNASNTSVVWHAGKLLSLWEGGWPHEIDPQSLATKSRFNYNGGLDNSFSAVDKMIFPEMAFSAHPKIHPLTGELFNFGTVPGTQQRLVQYRVDQEGKMSVGAVKMPGVVFTHDFVLTESMKKVFFFTPVKFGLFKMFSGFSPPVASMDVKKGNPIDVLILDENNQRIGNFQTDFGFIFHYANGFDLDENRVVADGFIMPDFPDAETNIKLFAGDDSATPAGKLTRFIFDLKNSTVEKHSLSPLAGELPSIHPDRTARDYEFVWCLALPEEANYQLLDGIQKVNVKTGEVISLSLYPNLPGEPLFVPHPNAQQEDEGWILTMVFHPDEEATYLYIYNAEDLSLITKGKLPHNIPLGFHGKFVPGMRLRDKETLRG